jgi:hypothetical protein
VPRKETKYFDKHPNLVQAAETTDRLNLPTAGLVTERILPLPKATRTALIKKSCPPNIQEQALATPGNKDCLVRVYLGSMQPRRDAPARMFNLRNFKLYLDQMAELGLDVDTLAHRMGKALAVIHWLAKADARDVEFVLGSSTKPVRNADPEKLEPLTYTGPESCITEDFFCRSTEFWVLDFNQVRKIEFDETGVAMAWKRTGSTIRISRGR